MATFNIILEKNISRQSVLENHYMTKHFTIFLFLIVAFKGCSTKW